MLKYPSLRVFNHARQAPTTFKKYRSPGKR
jgi:hypothetical protein